MYIKTFYRKIALEKFIGKPFATIACVYVHSLYVCTYMAKVNEKCYVHTFTICYVRTIEAVTYTRYNCYVHT